MSDDGDPVETAEFTSEDNAGEYAATFAYTKNLTAALPTFQQEVVFVHSAAEARERIYDQETLALASEQAEPEREGDPRPELNPRPYALIEDGAFKLRRVATCTFATEGNVFVSFEVPTPEEYRFDFDADDDAVKRDKFLRLKRWRIGLASRLMRDYQRLSGQSDAEGNPFLNVTDIDLDIPPSDAAEEVADVPFIGFKLRLDYR
jgi:hypothetical protein